jgi:uncharacterized protein with HEPN domain
MAERSPVAALQDIVNAIERIRGKVESIGFDEFEADWERKWVVERGAEIVSEASRRLPDDLKNRHPEIPWRKVAGIGNVLRHDYDAVSPRILWNIARNDLISLGRACREELMLAKARDGRESTDQPK